MAGMMAFGLLAAIGLALMVGFPVAFTLAGVALIFAGMVLVLLYKGARPLTGIYQMPAFFGFVVIAMTAFGTFAQLLLCPGRTKKPQG